MTYLLVGLVSFGASVVTVFSGFGLGSLLVALFVILFPVDVAVSAAAVVHLFHNLLKSTLFFRRAEPRIVIRFGLPAVVFAFVGAFMLSRLAEGSVRATWEIGDRTAVITPLKVLMGSMIAGFALLDLVPRLERLRPGERWLPVGGILSGFFGGLSGHQGAFRAAFLSQLDLKPEAYVGTQAVLALMVDVARLLVYGAALYAGHMSMVAGPGQWSVVGVAVVSAAAGVLLGWRYLHKTTLAGLRKLIGGLLLAVGCGLVLGVL
jgi:uncharacterized membrane protein YfcA